MNVTLSQIPRQIGEVVARGIITGATYVDEPRGGVCITPLIPSDFILTRLGESTRHTGPIADAIEAAQRITRDQGIANRMLYRANDIETPHGYWTKGDILHPNNLILIERSADSPTGFELQQVKTAPWPYIDLDDPTGRGPATFREFDMRDFPPRAVALVDQASVVHVDAHTLTAHHSNSGRKFTPSRWIAQSPPAPGRAAMI